MAGQPVSPIDLSAKVCEVLQQQEHAAAEQSAAGAEVVEQGTPQARVARGGRRSDVGGAESRVV